MSQDSSHPPSETPDQAAQLTLVTGYKSLLESYNLMSQSFSRYSELNQSSHILTQLQELSRENSKIKQENLNLQQVIHKLSTSIHELQNKPALSTLSFSSAPGEVRDFIHQVHSVSVSEDLIESCKAEISELKNQVQELIGFKTLSAELEVRNSELIRRLAACEADKENVKSEWEKLMNRVKKLEDWLEVTKVHRDLLKNKIVKMSIVGSDEQKSWFRQEDLCEVEKRFKVLEDRIKGTDEVEEYVRKYKEAVEKLQKSEVVVKNLQEKQETLIKNLKNTEKTLQIEKHKNLASSPKVLEKLVSLLYTQQTKKH